MQHSNLPCRKELFMEYIPLSEVCEVSKPSFQLLRWIHVELHHKYLDKIITFSYDLTIHMYELNDMRNRYHFEIPYGERSKWVDKCYLLNEMLGKNGSLILFVSNISYDLQSYIFIEYEKEDDMIKDFCKNNHIEWIHGKGNEEFFMDMSTCMWNETGFFPHMDYPLFKTMFLDTFYFQEIQELDQECYQWQKQYKRKKRNG